MLASLKLRVEQIRREALDVVSVTLVDPAGKALPAWSPGAHVSLELPTGVVRDYSLCSHPDDRYEWTVAVLRVADSRGGSSYVHEQLRVGDVVLASVPRNSFELEPSARYTFIAGGIGITPILSMVRQIEAEHREWRLLYAGRSRASMAFIDPLLEIAGERLEIHCDDERGGVADLSGFLRTQPADSLVYCCGPEPMLDSVKMCLEGSPRLRMERFRNSLEPTIAHSNMPFSIRCAKSDLCVHVSEDITALAALEAAGVSVVSSCEEGVCGTCEARVLRGKIDHRDEFLTDEEKERNESMMICVSRSREPTIELDI